MFGSAKLSAEICERFGQPGIVGKILAGVFIGPSVPGWLAPMMLALAVLVAAVATTILAPPLIKFAYRDAGRPVTAG